MSLEIIQEDRKDTPTEDNRSERLLQWLMARVEPWIDHRESNYKSKWDEYERLWRGIYKASDKSRQSERSKLISPALQQAIEVAVAEIEEATFGKGTWFDIQDDLDDKMAQAAQQAESDVEKYRKFLNQDFDEADVQSCMSETFLSGALYGTGISKIVVQENQKFRMVQEYGEATAETYDKVQVKPVTVDPRNFFIDTTATCIEEALGCGEELIVPIHSVIEKMKSGIYKSVDIGSYTGDEDLRQDETSAQIEGDKVHLIEYHGLVPASLIDPDIDLEEGEEFVDLMDVDEDNIDEFNLVEAVVTIANKHVVLRAVENPLVLQDRAYIAYQHDTVPNRFWGRGVAEKGYNIQKALDAELRGRIDSMALTLAPMMGVDSTRLPRGVNLSVQPGKTILTQGDPATILRPLTFGQTNNQTFHQSGDLERMLQMGTGSMDSATPTGINARNNTASGMSMIMSGMIKRSKRTLANIERHYTTKFVEKAAARYMQFDPERYPVMDLKFTVHSTLGIMAREVEQQQLSSLLNTVPPDSPAYWMLIRSIYENSSITNKDEMIPLVDQLLQQALQPQIPPEVQMQQQENERKAQLDVARLQIEQSRAQTEATRVMLEAQKVDSEVAKTQADAMLSFAKAEAESASTTLESLRLQLDATIAQSNGDQNGARDTESI